MKDPDTAGRTFGDLLRTWRRARGLSQLAFAGDAGISARHLSFLETGRSRPSREMIERLAETLGLSRLDQDGLMLAAGFAPVSDTSEVTDAVLAFLLSTETPYPTLIMDDHWNIRMRNVAAGRVFGSFRSNYQLPDAVANNALHILCHPNGLRRFVTDWDIYATPFLQAVERDAAKAPQSAAAHLRRDLDAYPDLPRPLHNGPAPLSTLNLQNGRIRLSFHTAFTTLRLPTASSLGSYRVETLFPADPATAGYLEEIRMESYL